MIHTQINFFVSITNNNLSETEMKIMHQLYEIIYLRVDCLCNPVPLRTI